MLAARNDAIGTKRTSGTVGSPERLVFEGGPWLPQMDVLNEVIGAVVADTPPARDIDGDATQMHKLPISGTHAFTDANQEGGEE